MADEIEVNGGEEMVVDSVKEVQKRDVKAKSVVTKGSKEIKAYLNLLLDKIYDDEEASGQVLLTISPGKTECDLSITVTPGAHVPTLDHLIALTSGPLLVSDLSFNACAHVLVSATSLMFLKTTAADFLVENFAEFKYLWKKAPPLIQAVLKLCETSEGALLDKVMRLVHLVAAEPEIEDVQLSADGVASLLQALANPNQNTRDSAMFSLHLLARKNEINKIAVGDRIQDVVNLLGHTRFGRIACLTLHEVCQVKRNVQKAADCELQPAIQSGAVNLQAKSFKSEAAVGLILLCMDEVGARQLTQSTVKGIIRRLLISMGMQVTRSIWDLCLVALEKIWHSFSPQQREIWKSTVRSLVSRMAKEGIGKTSLNAESVLLQIT